MRKQELPKLGLEFKYVYELVSYAFKLLARTPRAAWTLEKVTSRGQLENAVKGVDKAKMELIRAIDELRKAIRRYEKFV
jgi:hypothetical protein